MQRLAFLVLLCFAGTTVFVGNITSTDAQQADDSAMTDQQRIDLAYKHMTERLAAQTRASNQSQGTEPLSSSADARVAHETTVRATKAKYEAIVKAARADYYKSIIAEDDKYIQDLSTATTEAMRVQDLALAERLSQQKVSALAARMLHQKLRDRIPSALVIRATWDKENNSTDVTEKLKEIISNARRDFIVSSTVFGGSPRSRFYQGTLSITVTQDGQEGIIYASEDNRLPAVLFPPVPPADDPATIDGE